MVRTRSASRALWRWPNTSGRNGRIHPRESVGMSGSDQRLDAFVVIRAGACRRYVHALGSEAHAEKRRRFSACASDPSACTYRRQAPARMTTNASSRWSLPLIPTLSRGWIRPLRPLVFGHRHRALDADLVRTIHGFDALLVRTESTASAKPSALALHALPAGNLTFAGGI